MNDLKLIMMCFIAVQLLLSCNKTEQQALPELETGDITSVTRTSAVSGGSILSDGGSDIIAKGVCWSVEQNPTIQDNHTTDGSGKADFNSNLTGLTANHGYYVRAYATNGEGTSYGKEKVFRTLADSIPDNDTIPDTDTIPGTDTIPPDTDTVTPTAGTQIIANHTIVDRYDDIPQQWIDEVKKMWLSLAGESHGLAYLRGLVALEALDPKFDVSYTFGAPPQLPTNKHLRADLNSWGDLEHPSGWIWGYGEEDWFTSELAVTRTRAGIKYCNDNGYGLSAYGFVLCYDGSIMDATEYLNVTQGYADFCISSEYSTTIFFATGAVDDLNGQADERGYKKYMMYENIREFVKADKSRVLFDYADILYYDDGSQTPYFVNWNGHTFPVITPTNALPAKAGHIGAAGELRLAKAMWWMLARIAGWDGK